MAKTPGNHEGQAEGVSPISGTAPPAEYRWPPGTSGNPAGRKTAGASVREHVNAMAEAELTEADIRKIARDGSQPWPRRAAAERILRTLEAGDVADFLPVLNGEKTLAELRDEGVNTEIVKKLKPTEHGTEIELHDRSGADFDRICDRTDGKPRQAIELDARMPVEGIQIVVPGLTPKD